AEVARARAETEAEREALRARLARLQERRDRLYAEVRSDLEASFRRAHDEVARVIRTLQQAPSGREAERARRALRALEVRAQEDAAAAGASRPAAAGIAPLDWRHARPGDRVAV